MTGVDSERKRDSTGVGHPPALGNDDDGREPYVAGYLDPIDTDLGPVIPAEPCGMSEFSAKCEQPKIGYAIILS